MTFKLALRPDYETDVKIEFPVEGGRMESAEFRARFRRLSQPQLESLRERVTKGDLSDRGMLQEVLLALPGVQDEQGAQIADTREALDRALDVYPMQPTLIRAFYASLGGAREKN